MGSRPKMKLHSDVRESVGMEQTWGLDRINTLIEEPENVSIRIKECRLDGFRFDKSEYRADNALRTSIPATITATVPEGVSAAYHIGFILQDERGREVFTVYVRGERRGTAVADFDDNKQHLFFLSDSVELKSGDEIQLCVESDDGNYRTEDIVLLREKPAARPPRYEFDHIAAAENRITWVTTWAVQCTVEYTIVNRSTTTNPVKERLAVENHRVTLPDMRLGDTVRYRILANTRGGQEVTLDWREITWQPFIEPVTTKSGRIQLRVVPPGDADLTQCDWPVTSGVPFPRSSLSSPRSVRLFDAQGGAVAVQASATARWPDGSIKWLLLDFRHRGNSAQYVLEFGPTVKIPTPQIMTDSLPIELGDLILTDAIGKEHKTRITGLVEEERNGLRRCFRGTAQIGGTPFVYDMRIHLYPGLPWARVLLTFGHGPSPEEFTTVRSFAWHIPSLSGEARFVRQYTDDSYESSEGKGTRFAGQLGPVFFRDFWQNYPKELEIAPDCSTIWLLPRLTADKYDWAKGTFDEHKLFFWFDPGGAGGQVGGYKLRQGVTKTHEIWLGLDASQPLLDRPLFAVAPPRWYADSGAFGELTTADAKRLVVSDYDLKVDEMLEVYFGNRERNREYGMLNFGDWWGEREINWGNVEYDTQHAFFLQFARSADLRFLQAGEEAELHNRDVDTVHVHANSERVGCVFAHCIGHVGDYYTESPSPGRDRGSPQGTFTVSHTWCEGHMDHYFLTGDRRSFETGVKIANHYSTYGLLGYEFRNCRDAGWHLNLTLAVYRATGDPFYLNAARIIVDRVLERQTPEPKFNTKGGGWRRMLVPGHCICDPAHYGNAGFMVAVLLTGLKWYHLETEDPLVSRSISMAAHFLIDDMWAEEVKGFRYTSCPKSSVGTWPSFLMFDGIGYAYRLSQREGQPDKKLARHLLKGTKPAIHSMNAMGKYFGMYIRVTPHVVGLLAELQEKPVGLENLVRDV